MAPPPHIGKRTAATPTDDLLQVAARAAGIGTWDWDIRGGSMAWDDAMHEIYGVHRETFVPDYAGWRAMLHPDDAERMERAVEATLRGDCELYESFRFFRPDGTLRHVLATGRMYHDAQGDVVRMVGVNVDQTDRKLAEQSLQRHRDRLEDVVVARTSELERALMLHDQAMELTHVGHWSCEIDNPTHYTSSPRAAEVFGDVPSPGWIYSLAAWRDCIAAVDPAVADDVAEQFRRACAGLQPAYDVIYPYKRPIDQRIVWIHALGHLGRNPKTGAIEMYGVSQDITASLMAQREIEAARAAADAANRAKSIFLANMSHEIRTPMNAILGMSLLALRANPAGELRNYLENIHHAGQHLLGVINDVLDISKIEAGKLDIESSRFEVTALLRDIANVVADKVLSKRLRFNIDVAHDVPAELVGDRMRLQQVLINFVGNAVKFTERGAVTVSVDVLARTSREMRIRFAVQDTGIGLDESQQASIFSAFQQGDSSITRRYGGTGLGLAIAKHLIELMGGTVGVESRLAAGSTFWFVLPMSLVQLQIDPGRLDIDASAHRILVVEGAAHEISGVLAAMGFPVVSVQDIEDVVGTFTAADDRGRAFDTVVLDARWLQTATSTVTEDVQTAAASRPPRVIVIDDGKAGMSSGVVTIDRRNPLATAHAMADALKAAHRAPPGSTTLSSDMLRGVRVLVAEDNAFNQQVAKAFLEQAGAIVEVAEDGNAAVDMARHQAYDVVLMDMQMPGLGGLDATREIKHGTQRPVPAVIAFTASAMQHDRRSCLEAGMDDFVSKPIDPDRMLATLARWVARRRHARSV